MKVLQNVGYGVWIGCRILEIGISPLNFELGKIEILKCNDSLWHYLPTISRTHKSPSSFGAELQSRDPRVTFLQIPDLELKVQSEEVNLYPIGKAIYKPGSMAKIFAQQGKLSVVEALRYSSTFASKW